MIQVDKNTTVKIQKIRTPKIFAAITLSFEQDGFTEDWCVQNVQTKWQLDPDLGLHCLPRPTCPKI